MAQDLRKLLKDSPEEDLQLRDGHESRFKDRLAQALPKQEESITSSGNSGSGLNFFLKVAAVLIVAGGIVWFTVSKIGDKPSAEVVSVDEIVPLEKERTVQLSDLSPQFKKVEDYYLASIHVELARLEITDDNKELVDSFLKQLAALDAEYERLNKEITQSGISEEMVNAMVENLKLRLELLSKLKQKLKELKASQDAEMTV